MSWWCNDCGTSHDTTACPGPSPVVLTVGWKCKYCGEDNPTLTVIHDEVHCELEELRKLRDRIAVWGNDAGWRSQWSELTAEMDSIRARAKELGAQ